MKVMRNFFKKGYSVGNVKSKAKGQFISVNLPEM